MVMTREILSLPTITVVLPSFASASPMAMARPMTPLKASLTCAPVAASGSSVNRGMTTSSFLDLAIFDALVALTVRLLMVFPYVNRAGQTGA